MKLFLIEFLFIILLNISFSLTPNWDILNSSVELLSSTETKKEIYIKKNDCDECNPKLILKKVIENNNNEFSETNYIQINNDQPKECQWEDIESYYLLDNHILICPKGKNFMNEYNNGDFKELNPGNININDDWELTCYHQPKKYNYMFNFYLNQPQINRFYGIHIPEYNSNNWKNAEADDGLYDFIWTWEPNKYEDDNYRYNMYGLVLLHSKIQLHSIQIEIDTDYNFHYSDKITKFLGQKKNFSHGYFNKNTSLFYWISCNTIDDYISGYSTEPVDITKEHVDYKTIENSTSPFNFAENMEIIEINMIRNSKYAYYEILNEENNQTYHGIIDIEENRIIFNTNETLKEFKPFINNSMLAYTEYGVYQICTIKENNICVEHCSIGKLILDPENGNYCGEERECDNYTLIPENICINECDRNIYTLQEKKCGLCSVLYPDKTYYYLNEKECIENKKNKTYYVNYKLKIIADCSENCNECSSFEFCNICDDGYQNNEGKCILEVCHEKCDGCEKYSSNDNNQMCLKCKDSSLVLEEGNCIEKCHDGYYKEDKSCLKCNSNCTKCSKGEEKYNNDTIINQNCESCSSDFNYLIKEKDYPSNCVDECPNGLNATKDNYCQIIHKNEDDDDDNDYMLWIFIILIAVLLIIISFCIYKRNHRKKNDGEIINDINTELQDKNQLVL